MLRYILSKDVKFLMCSPMSKEQIEVFYSKENPIFVNILERRDQDHVWRIKLFHATGEIQEGWVLNMNEPVKIYNQDELFDGRFNA